MRTPREAMDQFKRYVDLRAAGKSWREIGRVTGRCAPWNCAFDLSVRLAGTLDLPLDEIQPKLDDKIILALRDEQAPTRISTTLGCDLERVLIVRSRAFKFGLLDGLSRQEQSA
jgi:hypothetical protein